MPLQPEDSFWFNHSLLQNTFLEPSSRVIIHWSATVRVPSRKRTICSFLIIIAILFLIFSNHSKIVSTISISQMWKPGQFKIFLCILGRELNAISEKGSRVEGHIIEQECQSVLLATFLQTPKCSIIYCQYIAEYNVINWVFSLFKFQKGGDLMVSISC